MRTGRFREDLYYRIHVIPIQLPPLRERTGDIPLLCEYFLQVHCVANGLPVKRIDGDALSAFEEHAWPGNVRELENLIQRLVVTVRGEEIRAQQSAAPRCWRERRRPRRRSWCRRRAPTSTRRFERVEIALLTTALHRDAGQQSRCGAAAAISMASA